MKVVVIGAQGFVGSALATWLTESLNIRVVEVTRLNYSQMVGAKSDVVIDASGNSKKYLAEENPVAEFDLSTRQRLRTLQEFPADLHVHVSSVDVYSDLSNTETTREDSPIDLPQVSHYGIHKLLAEQLVQHYAEKWLVVRLAGMVGKGLRKNPAYDILHDEPLRIHPESKYQFMGTRDVARIVWALVERNLSGEIFNVCGKGLISPREIAEMRGSALNLRLLDATAQPRIVHVNTEKIESLMPLPQTTQSITDFIRNGVEACV